MAKIYCAISAMEKPLSLPIIMNAAEGSILLGAEQ